MIWTLLACEIGFPRKIDLIYNVDMTARGSLFLLPDYCLNYSHDIDMRYKVWRNHHKVLKAFAATTIDESIITYCRFIGIDYNDNSYTKNDKYIRSYHYPKSHRYRYTTDIWKLFVPKVNWNTITVLDVGSLKQQKLLFHCWREYDISKWQMCLVIVICWADNWIYNEIHRSRSNTCYQILNLQISDVNAFPNYVQI